MLHATKDDSFYQRFYQQLLDTSSWPGVYVFKFIVPASGDAENTLNALFAKDDVSISIRTSSKGKYNSISVSGTFESPKVIIDKYKQAAKIPNIIQL
jgi:putative lipoic acid-binding regulatory protein